VKEIDIEHDWFKNWEVASSSVKCDILVEAFHKSEEQHGLRYTNFMGDEDSTVFFILKRNVAKYGFVFTKEKYLMFPTLTGKYLVKNKPQYKGRNKLTEAQGKCLASTV